jgi:DMSO/TMAO reductase YedYZ molybdopterin-dependent catalytic subunit
MTAVLLLSLCLFSGMAAAQPAQAPAPIPAEAVLLTVTGAGGTALRLTAADLAKLPRRTVRAADRGQEAASFEGIPLGELARLAGAPLGDAVKHGDAPNWYVVVESKDGYHTLFALAELDPAFQDKGIILVDRKEGKPLGDDEGPLRIVAPGEKRHARWARQVTGIRVGRM